MKFGRQQKPCLSFYQLQQGFPFLGLRDTIFVAVIEQGMWSWVEGVM
jgi:hypothetical protein